MEVRATSTNSQHSPPCVVGTTRPAELAPKTKHFDKDARNLQKMNTVYKFPNLTLRKRLRLANKHFHLQQSCLRQETVNFSLQQVLRKNAKSKGKSTEFSLDEKLICLGLYKTSGVEYRSLARWFDLPSSSTMAELLQTIPIESGINKCVISNLKKRAKHWNRKNRLCSLIFNEMPLTPGTDYDESSDKSLGIENTVVVDHVLVFMLKAVVGIWKQAIVYRFSKGVTKSVELKELIKDIVRTVNSKTGLEIISLICNQRSRYRAAVESLCEESKAYCLSRNIPPTRSIIIGNYEVIPLYDVPHIMKGIRNHLLNKNLIWLQPEKTLMARWKDIVVAYKIDASKGSIRLVPKVTKHHIKPEKKNKMKVAYATQVFSHKMAAAINLFVNYKNVHDIYKMDDNSRETGRILKFFDSLFDSLNGGAQKIDSWKILYGPVSKKSDHIFFWKTQIKALKDMYFVEEGSSKHIIPTSLKCCILSLEGYILLAQKILKYTNQYAPRNLNLDTLENLFDQIRPHRRFTSLTPKQFQEAYKVVMVQHIFGSPYPTHSIHSNCEEILESSLFQLTELLPRKNSQ